MLLLLLLLVWMKKNVRIRSRLLLIRKWICYLIRACSVQFDFDICFTTTINWTGKCMLVVVYIVFCFGGNSWTNEFMLILSVVNAESINDRQNQLKCAKFNYICWYRHFVNWFLLSFTFSPSPFRKLTSPPLSLSLTHQKHTHTHDLSGCAWLHLFQRLSDRLFVSICNTCIYLFYENVCTILWKNNAIIGNQSCLTNHKYKKYNK